MSRNVYALLVGINEYAPDSGVNRLEGCVPDILTIQEYLRDEERIIPHDLHLRCLLNEQATRKAVIDSFRNHLSKAKSEDTVLFYYAGHGSQEDAPEEFWTIEPDRLNETLVCYDSRSPNGLDLADKELATLIGEVAQNNPHIVLILDCCHSGSGSRNPLQGVAERRIPKSKRKRPLDSYILPESNLEWLKSAQRSPNQNPSGWLLPQGRHLLLAACSSHETAKEYFTEEGQKRGAFSQFLMQALTQANGNPTYRDLYQQVNALVRGNIAAQSPQLEATVSEDQDLSFLGEGAIHRRDAYFTVSYTNEQGWVINGGAIQGIANPVNDETTLLGLFSFNGENQGEDAEPPNPLAEATVTKVFPQLSQIQSDFLADFDRKTPLKAVVISQPLPLMGVKLIANTPEDEVGIDLIRRALQGDESGQRPSLYVAEEPESDKEKFRVLAKAGEYLVMRPSDDRPLITQLQGYTPENAEKTVKNLEHIARWLKVVELQSPSASRIPPSAIQVEILQGEGDKETAQTITDSQIQLMYQYDSSTQKWKQPKFRVKLTNNLKDPLFVALFDLTESFAVDANVFKGSTIRLNSGETAWVLDGNPIYGSVPDNLWSQGVTERKDILKAIACTTDFDATMMAQGKLGEPLPPKERSAKQGKGTLNRLMKRVITREFSECPQEEEIDDWIASEITFNIIRPQNAIAVSREISQPLGMGVTVQPHPTLNAKVRLTTVSQSTRDLGNRMIPPILQADPTIVQPFQFTASRGADPGLGVIELKLKSEEEKASRTTVTPQNPLILEVDHNQLQENEELLALAYDGEFYIPVGFGHNSDDGQQIQINIERLPEPVSEGERSLFGSIRIFFQKVASKLLKKEFAYPLLSTVDVEPDGTVNPYDSDLSSVKARVAQAKRIVLFVHGIIGDTESMVPCVKTTKIKVSEQDLPLAHPDVYDLVLAFDYENLNTAISDNARLLRERLAEVGLGKNHGKTLHIVAHSMGGLVSRWFIEREGGNEIVNHLIMLGTPNNGSPWPNVVNFALPLLTIGLNGLSAVAWPVSAISALMKLAGVATIGVKSQMTTTLTEMQPNSPFINSLFSSPSPHIPYTVITGNTSLIKVNEEENRRKISDLLKKMGSFVVELPFDGDPNDIAVKVDSITYLPERSPSAKIIPVPCDHLTYFTNPNGLSVLSQAVKQALNID